MPPNAQGAAALVALALDDGLPPGLHSQVEAMKLALADAHAHVAESDLGHVADGLSVIDGSVLPTIPSRGPHATTVMLAHRAAQFLTEAG